MTDGPRAGNHHRVLGDAPRSLEVEVGLEQRVERLADPTTPQRARLVERLPRRVLLHSAAERGDRVAPAAHRWIVDAEDPAVVAVQQPHHLERMHRLRLLRARHREQPVEHLERRRRVTGFDRVGEQVRRN